MNMTVGTVSVIIPVYNRENVIEECVCSVTAQSYQSFEIIITDDGSSDRTLEICQKLALNDPRIRVFSLNHGGVSAARNAALDAANGEYVFFLDSDDIIHSLLLETFVDALKSQNAAIAATDVMCIHAKNWSQNAEKLLNSPGPGQTECISFESALTSMLSTHSPLSLIGGVMIKRDLIRETRFRTDLHIGEDFCFIYEILTKVVPCIFLKQKWYGLRVHANNSSWDYSYNGFYSRFIRRKVIWQNEEARGRAELAKHQKRDAFGCFVRCYGMNNPASEDAENMRKVLLNHKKELLPALTTGGKIVYMLYTYCPGSVKFLYKIKKKLKRRT